MITVGTTTVVALVLSTLAIIAMIFLINRKIHKSQLRTVFRWNLILLLICCIGLLLQIALSNKLNIKPIYFDYIVYIGTCFLPVSVLLTGIVFANTRIKFNDNYLLLFIIPIFSLLALYTNDFHHLFFKEYSINMSEMVTGPVHFINTIYSYGCIFVGLVFLLKYSIKNSGFFSKQSILIFLGMLIPVTVNVLGTFNIIPMTIYITPITFSIAVLFFALAIFKFKFLSVAPIALQKIVDRISDSYLVLDYKYNVTDFNTTFLTTFGIPSTKMRNINIIDFFKEYYEGLDISNFLNALKVVKNSKETVSFEQKFDNINKFFTVEINTIYSGHSSIGTLILLKDITQHKEDVETIKSNQDLLIERERLASLGQMIGGIAHNLKTPIMSIAGAAEGLKDLANEYDNSIEDPEVLSEDHHAIAKDMYNWIDKIKNYTEYMSDIISAVKGQAVAFSDNTVYSFTIEELTKQVNILMRHELKKAIITLNINMNVDPHLEMHGNVNSLVQVINNMVSNSIQAYKGKANQTIDLEFNIDDKNLYILVKDNAGGIPKSVQDKLFNKMVTTKGKNGTGLGLFMSYSNIRAYFNGDIKFESVDGKGTTFCIVLPLNK